MLIIYDELGRVMQTERKIPQDIPLEVFIKQTFEKHRVFFNTYCREVILKHNLQKGIISDNEIVKHIDFENSAIVCSITENVKHPCIFKFKFCINESIFAEFLII